MEDKRSKMSIFNILAIIAIICIIIIGFFIYNLSKANSETNNSIQELQSEMEDIQTTLYTIQNSLNNTTESSVNSIEEIAKAFVSAVNEKDWDTAEKYSNSDVINALQKYNVSNLSIDYTTFSQNPNNTNSYYYHDDYDIDYNGLEHKDLGLGKLFCIDKTNDTYTITTFCATGL